jgi:fused signal recognition particle receptor
MFKFLKEKLKNVISKTSKKIDEEGETQEPSIEELEKNINPEDFIDKEELEDSKENDQKEKTDTKEGIENKVEPKEDTKDKKEKKGFFSRFKKEKKADSKEDDKEEDKEEEKDKSEESYEKHSKDKTPIKDQPSEKEPSSEAHKEEVKPVTAQDLLEELDQDPEDAIETKNKKVLVKEKEDKLQKEKQDNIQERGEDKYNEDQKEELSPEEEFEKKAEKAIKEVKEEHSLKDSDSDSDQESKVKDTKTEEENKENELEKKKGFFGKLKETFTTKKINYKQFEDIFYELEIILLENNVAMEVIDKIKKDLETEIVEKPIKRNAIESTITSTLKKSIEELFKVDEVNLVRKIKRHVEKPFVITFLGINGSGKTTTIAKFVEMLKSNNLKCVVAAADTFRAAAIDQLQIHANNLGVKLIKHDYGSDPAAVAYDAIKHAKSKDVDVVLVDTAGRIHSNSNLMEEMKKIIRVAKPDFKIFVGESITGNDCVEQAKKFDEAVGIDGIILSKADVDEKGGAAISVGYVTKKPILYIGVGQEYSDLKEFDPNLVVEGLGLSA